MLDLPRSAAYGRRITKQKFYEHITVTPQMRRLFVEQINLIYWQYKIAPGTVNVAGGTNVEEIEVFRIKLNQRNIDNRVLQLIDQKIPYHILYLLEHSGQMQACIGYQHRSQDKPLAYYRTPWLEPDYLDIKLDGLDMDTIYENFVWQIAGERLDKSKDTDIREAIAKDQRRQKLIKIIAAMEKKVHSEAQFNRQVELNRKLKQLQTELEEL